MKTQLQPTPPVQHSQTTTVTLDRQPPTPDLAALVVATKLARASGCHHVARRLYDQALQLIPQQPDATRCAWLKRLGARP